MGCCQSRVAGDDDAPPLPPAANHANSTAPVLGQSTSRLPSPRVLHSPRQPVSSTRSQRRSHSEHNDTPLAEHFNRPLVPHIWDGKHKYTRSLPGPNSRRQVWTRRSLEREREVFFETQTTGAPEVWLTLRSASELLRHGDISTAQGIIDAAEVTVPYGDLVYGVFDAQGQFYQMPEWAIADPSEVLDGDQHMDISDEENDEKDSDDSESRREAKGKGVLRPSDTHDVKARLSDRGGPGSDVIVQLGHEETIRVLARRVREEAGVQTKQTIRIAYLGKLLKENETLKSQGWKEGHIVNALVSG